MNSACPLSRRHFLATTAAAAAAATWTARSYGRILGANDRLGVGLIGVGNIGNSHIRNLNKLKKPNNLDPVAVADCWLARAQKGASALGASESMQDHRRLLDLKNIDYVVVAVPEHRHAELTLNALDAGKHVYCEKPMTHTIDEALAVVKKQKETNLAVQVGVQSMSDDSYASAAKAIEEGILGTVVHAQTEYVRRWGQGPWRGRGNFAHDMPKPEDLDWQAWLGPAPRVDWEPRRYFEWQNYLAYSGGPGTDLFVHRLTRIIKACNLTLPRRVVGMGGIWQWDDGRELPDNFEMIVEYPRGMTVYVLGTQSNRVPIEHLIRGYRGTLYFTKEGWVAKDKDDKVLAEHKKTGGEHIDLHHTNLQQHIREGVPLNCPPTLGMYGCVPLIMAIESWRSSRMMGWDANNQKMAPADTLNLPHTPDTSATS